MKPQNVPEKLLTIVPERITPLAANEGTAGLTVIVPVIETFQFPLVPSSQRAVPLPLPPNVYTVWALVLVPAPVIRMLPVAVGSSSNSAPVNVTGTKEEAVAVMTMGLWFLSPLLIMARVSATFPPELTVPVTIPDSVWVRLAPQTVPERETLQLPITNPPPVVSEAMPGVSVAVNDVALAVQVPGPPGHCCTAPLPVPLPLKTVWLPLVDAVKVRLRLPAEEKLLDSNPVTMTPATGPLIDCALPFRNMGGTPKLPPIFTLVAPPGRTLLEMIGAAEIPPRF